MVLVWECEIEIFFLGSLEDCFEGDIHSKFQLP